MPINHTPTFDPYDEGSWFFGFMSRADATELLSNNNETGAFLVRESTTARGNLVLSVKENDDKVSHYIINTIPSANDQQVCFMIGEQTFRDIPTLLTYYRTHNLDDIPLKVPACTENPPLSKRSFTYDFLAEVLKERARNPLKKELPRLAKVIQSRIPNAYDKTALTLEEGDIVLVTRVDISGCWEGEILENKSSEVKVREGDICGRKGHFPFNYVKFIEDSNE